MATPGVGITNPTNLAGKGVNAGLLRTAWSNKIYYESLRHDPLFNIPSLTEVVNPGKDETMLGDGFVFHDITPAGNEKYARKVILQMTKALDGDATEGNATEVLGNEENIRLKYFTAFANDWAKAVTTQEFGIDFREIKPTKIYDRARDLLAQWLGEYRGYSARHAMLRRISPNLTAAPISLTPSWNQNMRIVGATEANQPVYDSVDADYEDNIIASIASATLAHLTIPEILKLADVAANKYIKPVKIKDKELYLFFVAEEEYRRLTDPSIAGSYASYWTEAAGLTDGYFDKVIPGSKFCVADRILVCCDDRAAVVESDGAATLSDLYLKMGRNDERTTASAANIMNVNMLLGEHALVKFEPERPHFEDQDDVYTKYMGKGYFGAFSYQIPSFDVDTPTDTTNQQEGSISVLTLRED